MKTVNGGLLIVLAFFILWIGVTDRFPALIAAIGLVKGTAPKSPVDSTGNTSKAGSGSLSLTPVPLAGKTNPSTIDLINAPISEVWADAIKKIVAASKANPMEIAVP